jgi:putative transposase
MSDYRRLRLQGGCYFFTVVTRDRAPLFAVNDNVVRLRAAIQHVRAKHPFDIDAIVALHDHLHALWTLPEGDADYALRWRLIKRYLSLVIDAPVNARREKLIWQRRYWEHTIRDERDWQLHMDYVFYNPVKHGYVSRPIEWPWSNLRGAVERGWYDENWGAAEPDSIKGMEFE